MRKLGLIGGMSWVSTVMYYEGINKGIARRAGPFRSAPLLIESIDFSLILERQAQGDWDGIARILTISAQRLQDAGAQGLILCCNTGHKVFDEIAAGIEIPILHIADVVTERLIKKGVKRVGLLGTKFTLAQRFYQGRLESAGINVAPPDLATSGEIDRIIFEELARGHVSRTSQRTLKTCLTQMDKDRQQAVILACTELVLLVDPVANVLPVYDSTAIHADAAAEWIVGEREIMRAEPAKIFDVA